MTGKVYVGESFNIARRIIRHKTDLKNNCHCNPYLQRHINKYGTEDLTFEIVEIISSLDHNVLLEREKFWIQFHRSNESLSGFNLNAGGMGGANTTVRHKDFSLIRMKDKFKATFKTIADFENFSGKLRHKIREVLKGQRKISCGWTTPENFTLIENKKEKVKKGRSRPPLYVKTFRLKNTMTGETIEGTGILQFSKENNLCYNSLLRVVRGERKKHGVWMTA